MTGRALRQAACIGLLAAAAPVAAQTSGTWTRLTAPDGAFSVETPCTKSESDATVGTPGPGATALVYGSKARIVCIKDALMFVAAEVAEPALPADSPALFDVVVEQMLGDKTAEGAPASTTIDGRRAYVNRQVQGDDTAQTGLVEIDRTRLVLLLSNVQRTGGAGAPQQRAAIDRFYASLRVTSK